MARVFPAWRGPWWRNMRALRREIKVNLDIAQPPGLPIYKGWIDLLVVPARRSIVDPHSTHAAFASSASSGGHGAHHQEAA